MSYNTISVITFFLVISYIYFKTYRFIFDRYENPKQSGYLIILTGILFFCYHLYLEEHDQQLTDYDYSIWHSGVIVFFIWVTSNSYKLSSISAHFLAEKRKEGLLQISDYVKVTEKCSKYIPVYPRVTIKEGDVLFFGKQEDLLFDSSDFNVVNEALGSLNGVGASITIGSELKLKSKSYRVEEFQVDFLNFFDDYSGMYGHTPVYKGDNVPYNIQISIRVRHLPIINDQQETTPS